MDRKRLTKNLILLMLLMFFTNSLALRFYWYYSIWWFDIPMHFLGGLWAGLFFLWFFSIGGLPFCRITLDSISFSVAWKTLLFVFIIGATWELFELLTNNYIGREPFSLLDTASDMFFDVAGGMVAVSFYIKRIMVTPPPKAELK